MAYLCSIKGYVCAAGVLLAACDDGEEVCGDPGRWSTELIPAEKVSGADHAFDADGALHVVYKWDIPDGGYEEAEFGERRIRWLHRSGEQWTSELVSSDGHDNVVGYSLTAAVDRLHLIWRNNYSNSSVHYRWFDGATWSPVVELIGAIETLPMANASLIGHADQLALVYATSEAGSNRSDTLRVRVGWIEDGGLAGEPVTLLEGHLGCFYGGSAFDQAGSLHVLASCPTGEREGTVYHVTLANQEVAEEPIGSYSWDGDLRFVPPLALAAEADGTLHAVWSTMSSGGTVLHARRVGGQWTAPAEVPGPTTRAGVRVLPGGEVIIVYVAEGETSDRVRFLSWDGTAFAPDCDRLPDLEVANGNQGAGLSIEPATGALFAVHQGTADSLALSTLEATGE